MLEQTFPRDALAPQAPEGAFLEAVLEGLTSDPKTLPCAYLYDARGSALFEEITRLPEYYPTRTETAILQTHAADMVAAVPDGSVLVEFGSGSSTKTEILLRHMPTLSAYVAVDVSASALNDARRRLRARFPDLDVRPVLGDFVAMPAWPADLARCPRVGFFPGSTIGNFAPADAIALLRSFSRSLGKTGRLLIGVDLKKDRDELLRAYDDAAGVTAAFNLNILARINRELGGRFDLATFRHRVRYDSKLGRIEMHLASMVAQDVRVAGHTVAFRAGETIHTENSYKYTCREFRALADSAGWSPGRVWQDEAQRFSVHELLSA